VQRRKSAMPHNHTMPPKKIRELFARFAAADPEPKSELEYDTPFQLLIAVILSAQATDKSVNLCTRKLFRLAPDAARMVELGEDSVADCIRTIGLFRSKAKNVIAASRLLLERHDGQVPPERAALEALPGVGRKTASVVLNVAFGEPTIAVDTHIFRVGNRTGLAPGKDVLEVERNLQRAVPAEYRLHAHHWLILHGRYVCKARKPDCAACLIRDLCQYPARNRPPPCPSPLQPL